MNEEAPIQEPYAEEHRRALEFLARLTPEEGVALLKRAGILDQDGHLAPKYTSPGEPIHQGSEPTPAP